jgi:hypothetical protein
MRGFDSPFDVAQLALTLPELKHDWKTTKNRNNSRNPTN